MKHCSSRHLALFIESIGTWHYLRTNHKHALIFLEYMVDEHVFMNLVPHPPSELCRLLSLEWFFKTFEHTNLGGPVVIHD